MAKQKIAGLPIEGQLTMREAVAIAVALTMLPKGKVAPQPKTPDKPKFRPVLKRRHDAMPWEVRELEQSGQFRSLCIRNSIVCTRRQASKYLQKRGQAYVAHMLEKQNQECASE